MVGSRFGEQPDLSRLILATQ